MYLCRFQTSLIPHILVHKITECVLCAVCVQMCVCVRDYACMPHVHVYGGDIKKTRTIRYTAIKFRSIKYRMVLSIVLNRDSFTTKIPFHFAIRTTTAFNTTFFFIYYRFHFILKKKKIRKFNGVMREPSEQFVSIFCCHIQFQMIALSLTIISNIIIISQLGNASAVNLIGINFLCL